jgi:hypothetical protein
MSSLNALCSGGCGIDLRGYSELRRSYQSAFSRNARFEKKAEKFSLYIHLGGKNEEILVSFAVTGVNRSLQHVSDGR